MNTKEYSSAIKKTPFEYVPSKKIANLIREGKLYEEAYKMCFDDNLLQITSEQRRQEVFNVVYDRMIGLDDYLLNEFIDGSLNTSKFILVYAIAKNDQLFFEFLLDKYREAILGNKEYISISDFDEFFSSAKERNPIVAKWADITLKHLRGGYRNIIIDSGLGHREKKLIYVDKASVNPGVIEHIKKIGDASFLKAVLGE